MKWFRALLLPLVGLILVTYAGNATILPDGRSVRDVLIVTNSSSGIIQADTSVKIDVATAATTQLVALTASQKIYVTSWNVLAGGTGNIKLVYGTGANCGTGTTDLTGSYSLVAQANIAIGGGLGPVLIVPAGNALCATTSAAVQMSGSVSYVKF